MDHLQLTLKNLASGKANPRVQWLNMETKVPQIAGHSKIFEETGKKDERVLEAQTDESLRNLPQARLRHLLAAQQAIAHTPLCKRLPDGGAKVHKKIAQIQAALDYVIKVDGLVDNLELDLNRLALKDEAEAKGSPETDPQILAHATAKLEKLQRAKLPYSQASRAVSLQPLGPRPGVNPKYLPSAPKFLTFAEAAELSRTSRQAALELEQRAIEERYEVTESKRSAFSSAKWHEPVDFSNNESYRDRQESEEDDSEEEISDSEDELQDPDGVEDLPSW
jgi:hypothetical protein